MAQEMLGASFVLGAIYISVWKLLGMVVLGASWFKYCEWGDKDAQAVNTFRSLWNLGNVITMMISLACAILVPSFAIGYSVAWVLFLGISIAYVVHRNGLVTEESTVMTPAHFRRIQETGFSGKGKKKKEKVVVERVTLRGPNGNIRIPSEDEEKDQFTAVQELISDVLLRRASRIEVVPSGEVAKVLYEVDGEVVERDPLEREVADGAVTFLKKSLGLDLEEKRKPQTGKLGAKIGENEFVLNVRTDGSVAGEKLTLTIIGPESKFKVKHLGFTPTQLKHVDEILQADDGLILVGAPKKSGLTTTIYAFARSHDAFLKNIQLLEYKTELEIDNVTQKQFAPSNEQTFTDELMRMVRSDPDILIVPEIREAKSPPAIANAAKKSLVYCGLPTTDATDMVRKWMKFVGDNSLVAQTLRAAVNQRLIRKLCKECKEAYKPDSGLLKKLNLPSDSVFYRVPEPEYDKHGHAILCPACQGTGFVGRTAILELLMVNDELRTAIKRGADAEVQAAISKCATANLQRQGMAKVLDGTTSIKELLNVMQTGSGGGGDASGGRRSSPKPKQPRQSA
ncbi:MAG: GspE/PulE family protein [Phycisphaerae bacterium]